MKMRLADYTMRFKAWNGQLFPPAKSVIVISVAFKFQPFVIKPIIYEHHVDISGTIDSYEVVKHRLNDSKEFAVHILG